MSEEIDIKPPIELLTGMVHSGLSSAYSQSSTSSRLPSATTSRPDVSYGYQDMNVPVSVRSSESSRLHDTYGGVSKNRPAYHHPVRDNRSDPTGGFIGSDADYRGAHRSGLSDMAAMIVNGYVNQSDAYSISHTQPVTYQSSSSSAALSQPSYIRTSATPQGHFIQQRGGITPLGKSFASGHPPYEYQQQQQHLPQRASYPERFDPEGSRAAHGQPVPFSSGSNIPSSMSVSASPALAMEQRDPRFRRRCSS